MIDAPQPKQQTRAIEVNEQTDPKNSNSFSEDVLGIQTVNAVSKRSIRVKTLLNNKETEFVVATGATINIMSFETNQPASRIKPLGTYRRTNILL